MRYNGNGVRTNAEVDGDLLEKVAGPDGPGRQMLAQAAEAMRLSARGYTRVLRVARTGRTEEHPSELQSLMRISYAVFCLKKKHIKSDSTRPRGTHESKNQRETAQNTEP